MSHGDINEFSDPRDLTIDDPMRASVLKVEVLQGQPSDEEIAALVTVLAGAASSTTDAGGPQELNTWGHPIDKLRYSVASWQRVTLVERMHMRR